MKKLLIAISIVIFLIVGTFGSAVMAAPEKNPVEAWNRIAQKVDDIVDILFDLGDNVSDLDSDVVAVANQVSDLDSDVAVVADNVTTLLDNQAHSVKIDTAQGFVKTNTTEQTIVYVFESPLYDEGAHFSITVDARELTSPENISVHAGWSGEGVGSYSRNIDTISASESPGLYTYEVTARRCAVSYVSESDSANLTFGWGVTTTYLSDPIILP